MSSGRINRFNMFDYAPYQRMEYQRARRAEAQEMMAKSNALANGFAAIQSKNIAEQGNLISKIAMKRMGKLA